MAFLFGGGDIAPAPVPIAPLASDDAARAREEAELAALRESKAAGRRSTMVGGMKIAEEEQWATGVLSASRRAGADLVG